MRRIVRELVIGGISRCFGQTETESGLQWIKEVMLPVRNMLAFKEICHKFMVKVVKKRTEATETKAVCFYFSLTEGAAVLRLSVSRLTPHRIEEIWT